MVGTIAYTCVGDLVDQDSEEEVDECSCLHCCKFWVFLVYKRLVSQTCDDRGHSLYLLKFPQYMNIVDVFLIS